MTMPAVAAAQGLYAGGQFGFGLGDGEFDNTGFDLDLDSSPFINGFVGKDLGSVRLEGEIAYRQNDMDNLGGVPVVGEMSSTALMATVITILAVVPVSHRMCGSVSAEPTSSSTAR